MTTPKVQIFDRDLKKQKEYWIRKLSGPVSGSTLRLDYERPAVFEPQLDYVPIELSAALGSMIGKLTGDSPFLIYATLLAALEVCIYKYTKDERVVLGSPVRVRANGSQPRNSAVVIVDTVIDNISFRDLLLQVRQNLLEAYDSQDYPYERILQDLGVAKCKSRCELFNIALALQNIHADPPSLRNDLTISFVSTPPSLYGKLTYNRKLFRRPTIESFARHYVHTLTVLITDTNILIGNVDLLSPAERRQLLIDWNNTTRNYVRNDCIHTLFERQVERIPGAVATVFGDRELTYRELNDKANYVASSLSTMGIGKGSCVPLLMDRSLEMIIGLLAVMKTGAAFVPLDINWPADRIKDALTDLNSKVILVTKATPYKQKLFEPGFFLVDSETRTSQPNLNVSIDLDDPIYVIYTSGSTGKAKGVIIPHRGITNRFLWMNEHFGEEAAVALQTTSHVYDSAVWQLFWPLINGGKTVIPPAELEMTAGSLTDLIERHGVTITDFVPSVFNLIVPQLVAGDQVKNKLRSLRHLVVGGEAITPAATYKFLNHFPDVHIVNLYGPTEASIGCISYCVTGNEDDKIPIGKPIANMHALILDEQRKLVPVGIPGEIYLSGIGLARGYLNDQEKTEAAFVKNPFPEIRFDRLYRTGDQARYLSSGDIEFLGRTDNQVKIRGFRIELGECEVVLGRHPAIENAVVVSREGESNNGRLVAFFTVRPQTMPPTSRELRIFMQAKLPDYMIPAVFVMLPEFPLTTSGKVDRQALALTELSLPEFKADYQGPRTRTEDLLCGIWCEVLNLNQVGIDSNFFELGGHSLLATQVISRVRETFPIEIELRRLFEQPTVAGLAQTIEERLRKGEARRLPAVGAVDSASGPMPLSFAQQRLWFMEQLQPDTATYNMPGAVSLKGRLQVAALEQSLTEVVRRQASLRTSFVDVEGEPRQVIATARDWELPVVDLCHWRGEERQGEVQRLAAAEAQRPFDLTQGPLLRTIVIKLEPDEHVLLLTMHHIISDGWSIAVLIRELTTLYEAFSAGRPSPLPDLPIQYADYAVWQRGHLQGEALEEQLRYWRAQLHGAPALLALPTDKPRPKLQTMRGAGIETKLPLEQTSALKELAQREGATLFMLLLAAWQLLLSRYSGQQDIVVGVPIANRNRGETEDLIGFFVNTLPLRSDLSGSPSFRELLGRVKEVALDGFAHQDLPFEKLVEELQPERSLSHMPLLQVLFAHENIPQSTLELAGLEFQHFEFSRDTTKVDLFLSSAEIPDGLALTFEYNTDLFESQTIASIARHFSTLLAGIAGDPEQRIADLALLSEAERRRSLRDWNETASKYEPGTIHELFERQAEAIPAAVALVQGAERVCYRELNERANQLAHYLRGEGVGPDTLVAVCLERSIEMVVALLGILKAGGAYLPLDASYPTERLRYMVADSKAKLVLTQTKLGELWAETTKTLYVEQISGQVEQESRERVANEVEAGHLAYVIYTSGSTGQPKGVMITHRGLVNYLHWSVKAYNLSRDGAARLGSPLHSSISFDLSITSLWAPLVAGESVLLVTEERGLEGLVKSLREHGPYELVKLTPSHLAILNQELGSAELSRCARVLVVGGEALGSERVRVWREHAPETRVINEYGPTETVVGCCAYELGEKTRWEGEVPIGRPVANTQMYLLDGRMEPVAIGVVGELYVGGDGLARGYFGQPELTAEKFVPNPFAEQGGGARLYRTGDLGRYRSDGDLEFLGRLDEQVKLHGFRIELGEIESVLDRHSQVEKSAVVMHEENSGDKRIVAYFVAAEETAPSPSDLRAHIQTFLPEYMVPSVFVKLASLPLTPNKKIDRLALTTLGFTPEAGAELLVELRTPAEEIVAGFLTELLRIEHVKVEDNFFDLGGHSILATQLLVRLKKAFQVEIPLVRIFESPTVRGIAAHCDAAVRKGRGLSLPQIEIAARDQQLPLSFSQQRLWFLDQLEPNNPFYNVASALRLTGNLNIAALEYSLNEIIKRHEILRTVFVAQRGTPRQVILPPGITLLPRIDLTKIAAQKREAEVRRLIDAEARRPFDLAHGPLLRVELLSLDSQDHVMLLTMHHIIGDGWSTGVLIREFATLYQAYSNGLSSPLAPLPIQYVDYACWQRNWLEGDILERQLSFWKHQLAGMPSVLDLPLARPRPKVQSFKGATLTTKLPANLSDQLKALSRAEGVTLFMILLAAWQILISCYTGQKDIIVGTVVANRNRTELEQLVGFFVNTLVLRTDLSGAPSFKELLRRVRDVCLGAYAHQDIPFEKLVEELQPNRDLSRSPLFQTMFVLQNAPQTRLELAGLTLDTLDAESEVSKFDLTFSLTESAEGIRGELTYSTQLFARETMERVLGQYARLLESVARGDGEHRVQWLSMLSEAEREQVLHEWPRARARYEENGCLQELFEREVERRPEAVAVVYEGRGISYGELNRRANQLAHYLRAQGVGVEEVVGLYLERSLELVIGVLGILKAGGAYLPLEPSQPAERVQFMLEDAQVRLVVTQAKLAGELAGLKTVSLDDEWLALSEQSESNPAVLGSGQNVAYLIYTSGSTGKPKGVMVSHYNVTRLFAASAAHYEFGPVDVWTLFHSYAFDFSVWELWGALLHGGRLVVVPYWVSRTPAAFWELLRAERVTVLNQTPSAFRQLQEVSADAEELSLRYVIFGGEPLERADVNWWFARDGEAAVELVNMYGITETTVHVSHGRVPANGHGIGIGKGLADLEVYLLDEHQQPVAVGVGGELYVGGGGLARGYWQRPELTAPRFIPHPYSGEGGARLYRTGDSGRYLADGNIEYLGRMDEQVKVRGFRVELGEIEAVLREQVGVRECAVLALEKEAGEKQLVAYVVGVEGGVPAVSELRQYLKEKLPDYMIPVFVNVSELPLTANGKLDRKALVALTGEAASGDEGYEGPRTALEELLAGIYGEVLELGAVSRNESFFDLGGHSLAATRVISRVQELFQVEVALRSLFERPTVAGLAEAVAEALGAEAGAVAALAELERVE